MSIYRDQAPVLAVAAAIVGTGVLWCAVRWTRTPHPRRIQTMAGAVLTGWVLAILTIPLRPLSTDPQPRTIHWMPFTTGSDPLELAANVALFAPLGLAVALLTLQHFPRPHAGDDGRAAPGGIRAPAPGTGWSTARGAVLRAAVAGASCSLLVELAQLAQGAGRTCESTDVLTNTLGSILGAALTTAVLLRATAPTDRPAQDQAH